MKEISVPQSAVIEKYAENHNLKGLHNKFATDFSELARDTFNEVKDKCGDEASYHMGFARGYELVMRLLAKRALPGRFADAYIAECKACADESYLNELELIHRYVSGNVKDDEMLVVMLKCPNCGGREFTVHTEISGSELRGMKS